ncbi:hypothetical protein L1987_27654 [Smallanthus sonchifolius]|uniref:Uncharacterized protein n=1 Tax=Smallanthus sonchifolius TaxID=185202 RepID=A0ACB9ID00_9ASTR|nr:hypothetical protein L1987_27654 [Smallanthus sonchifolius]
MVRLGLRDEEKGHSGARRRWQTRIEKVVGDDSDGCHGGSRSGVTAAAGGGGYGDVPSKEIELRWRHGTVEKQGGWRPAVVVVVKEEATTMVRLGLHDEEKGPQWCSKEMAKADREGGGRRQ